MSGSVDQDMPTGPKPNLSAAFELINKARQCTSVTELYFLLVNLTKQMVNYQQAILYREGRGFVAASGLSELDVSSPMLIWLKGFIQNLHQTGKTGQIDLASLGEEWSSGYSEWFSSGIVAIPIELGDVENYAYLLLFRDEIFSNEELAALEFWVNSWILCLRILEQVRQPGNLDLFDHISDFLIMLRERLPGQLMKAYGRIKEVATQFFSGGYKSLFQVGFYRRWWQTFKKRFKQDKKFRWKACIFLLIFLPVRLTIIAPGEIVASQPTLIRAPIDGVLEKFYVEPNSFVKQGQNLFSYDNAALLAKAEAAKQSFLSAEAEYRQTSIAALSDSKQKVNLAVLQAKASEKKADYQFLAGQVQRSVLTAPFDGWAIFDDPADQVGKPISIGEKIMMLADPKDVEIQAWISLSDMIEIHRGASIKLYLNPNPFSAVNGYVKYITYEPVQLPDGQYAYRLRALIAHTETLPRLGLKGTVKVSGSYVPAFYWVFRKPLAQIRQFIGF